MNTNLGTFDRSLLEEVHHQLRTPLTVLLGHVELIEDANEDLPYRLEIALHAVSRSGDRLREVLTRLDELVEALPSRPEFTEVAVSA